MSISSTNTIYDTPCAACQGEGTDDDDAACHFCDGYGCLPTETGLRLIEFLQRRGAQFAMSPLAEENLTAMIE